MTATPRRRRGRGLACFFALLGAAVVLAVAGGGVVLYGRGQLEAPAAAHGDAVEVEVHSGETVSELAADLQAKGLIRSAFWFEWYARFKNLSTNLRAGRFKLDAGMGASAVIARLEGPPDVTLFKVILPEGFTAAQMASRVAASGVGITADQYLAEVKGGAFDEPFLRGRTAGASLEGFLFPDTYEVPQGTNAHQLVQMQLNDFAKRAGALVASPPHGLTPYQMVTLASLVEREARFADDRPKVAAVIYNRLAQGMNLQVDATVLYGLGISGQSPTDDQIHQDTPYNTYIHSGLPPTPIANPGLASLQAAAQPDNDKFLFYVSDACGHNHYSTTVEQHNAAISKYLNSPCPS